MFPLSVALLTGALLIVVMVEQVFRLPSHPVLKDDEQAVAMAGEDRPTSLYYLAWFLLLIGCVYVLGYPIGAVTFVVAFISWEVRGPFWRKLMAGLGITALLTLLSYWLNLSYPPGILPIYFDLPWWLG